MTQQDVRPSPEQDPAHGQQPQYVQYVQVPPGFNGQPQYVGTPPQPPKKRSWVRRHKFLTLLGIIAAIVIIVMIAKGTGGGSDAVGPAGGTGGAGAKAQTASVGQAVKDGKFQFTVTSVKCGVKALGPSGFATAAQGQFCLVGVRVQNIGNEAQTLDGSNQTAYDNQGRKVSADDAAALELPQAQQTFLNEINPGNTVNGVIVYDIPKTSKLSRIELHDSMFSGGVTVNLS